MREIKFRAWDNINKCMALDIHHLDSLNEYLHKDKYNVMQFTGLKDKNGVDVYEGDVLITKYQDKAKMIWHNEFACFCYETIDEVIKGEYQFTFKDVEVEVIGNIYEHPNLLEL